MIQEIQQLEKQIQTWKNLSMFQDFSKEIAEAEAKIEEMKQQKDINIVILETETIETETIEAEEIEETKADTIEIEETKEIEEEADNERIWLVPMNTSFVDCGKKDKNYMDYKALALFMYFSKRKSEEVCEMLGLDISEVEEHRFLYDNFINEETKIKSFKIPQISNLSNSGCSYYEKSFIIVPKEVIDHVVSLYNTLTNNDIVIDGVSLSVDFDRKENQ